MAFVVVDTVSCYYGSQAALEQLSFQVETSETLAVIGPNGAGKSTLLQCLSGVQLPDNGTIQVGQWDLSSVEQYRKCKEEFRIGYLPQQSLLYADLSIRENLELIAGLHKLADHRQEVLRMLELFGIESIADRRIRHCSQGVVRRAGAARALLGNPQLLLLDEPFAHLDQQGCDKLSALLAERQAKGATTIIATHLVDRVRSLAGRTLYLNNGRMTEEYQQD